MMGKIKDLTGQKIGNFEVICDSGKRKLNKNSNKSNVIWRAKCLFCNKIVEYIRYKLDIHKSCGCMKVELQRKNKNIWKGFGEIGLSYWNKLKEGAINRKLVFEITIEDGWNLFLKQNRACALTGENLCFADRCDSFNGTASLDRIDSTKGYVIDNIQWVHKDVNFMKQQFSESKFISWCTKVVEYRGS